jgi:4-alpha-glucanotransferase
MPIPLISYSSSVTYEEALSRAAELWGIESEYWDIWGNRHHATPEGVAAVLASLGVASDSLEALDRASEERLWSRWSRIAPLTAVINAHNPHLRLRLPAEAASNSEVKITIRFEDGTHASASSPIRIEPDAQRARLRGREFVEAWAPIPADGRLGYHDLTVEHPGLPAANVRLILSPDRAFFPEAIAGNGRAAGISVSLYGVRSASNWGCGDFSDLKTLIDWVARDLGASFIGLNPLHAIPNRQPYNTSPYLPACSFYRNHIYLDITAIPEFAENRCARQLAEGPAVRKLIDGLREAEFVEYQGVARLKLRFLKLLFRFFLKKFRANSPDAQPFRAYIEEQGRLLDDWAVYSVLDETIRRANRNIWLWTDWPTDYQDPRSQATREFAARNWRSVLFYKFIQWQIEVQLEAAQLHAKDRGLAIGLYHDLALATDRFGADLWANRPFYVGGCRVGAPPDDFSPNGQDWSFPPPNSDAHYEDGYRLFAESIRKNLGHGGALRIDHVMRFFHLFWIPNSLGDARRGIYVRDRHEDLIRILALESVRNKVLVVGEDLGTVADEVRETLHRFGILSYRLFYFEKWGDGRMRLPHEYPKQALVSASTHDLPTLAGFWQNRDIEARREVGVFRNEDDYHKSLADRMVDKQRMLDALFNLGLLPRNCPRSAADYKELTGDLHNAIVGFLASTPSTLMVLSEEDLMKQLDQQNLPGTTAEYPNWCHKTRFPAEEFGKNFGLDCTNMYRGWLNVTARLNTMRRP